MPPPSSFDLLKRFKQSIIVLISIGEPASVPCNLQERERNHDGAKREKECRFELESEQGRIKQKKNSNPFCSRYEAQSADGVARCCDFEAISSTKGISNNK